ncbi:MAG: hypothetical protein HQL63_08975 [Magnetococcales bacterium]|nr:hypothetical protein [Magnetococcales bacterium]
MSVKIHESAIVHPTAVIGYSLPGEVEESTIIEAGVIIGAFCVIEAGAYLEADVILAHHSVVGRGSRIGQRSQLVDAVRVARHALIGPDCIIGGNIPDRTVIGPKVTMMGEMSHQYQDATLKWGEVDEVSPIIREGVVIAQGAEIVGGIVIGKGSYIAAGEIVRSDVPAKTFIGSGKWRPLKSMRGLVRARS